MGSVGQFGFDVICKLGSGGFGSVHLVSKSRHGQKKFFAAKTIPKLTGQETRLERAIEKERNALAISHSNFIVELFYSFEDANNVYLVMDYMIGGNVGALLNRVIEETGAAFTEDATVFYVAETAMAIDYLHAKQIIHCDVKPSNLMLDAEGHVKLTDFGLVRGFGLRSVQLQDLVRKVAPRTRRLGRSVNETVLDESLEQQHKACPCLSEWTPNMVHSLVKPLSFGRKNAHRPRLPPLPSSAGSPPLPSSTGSPVPCRLFSDKINLNTSGCNRNNSASFMDVDESVEVDRRQGIMAVKGQHHVDYSILGNSSQMHAACANASHRRPYSEMTNISMVPELSALSFASSFQQHDCDGQMLATPPPPSRKGILSYRAHQFDSAASRCGSQASFLSSATDDHLRFSGYDLLKNSSFVYSIDEHATASSICDDSSFAETSDEQSALRSWPSQPSTANEPLMPHSLSPIPHEAPVSPPLADNERKKEPNTQSTAIRPAGQAAGHGPGSDKENDAGSNHCVAALVTPLRGRQLSKPVRRNFPHNHSASSVSPDSVPLSQCTSSPDLWSPSSSSRSDNLRCSLYYVAPEQITDDAQSSYPVDWWALGVCLFELHLGVQPFGLNASSEEEVLDDVCNGQLPWPLIDDDAGLDYTTAFRRCVEMLCCVDPLRRARFSDLRQSELFRRVDFSSLRERPAPWRPDVSGPDDTKHFNVTPSK